MPIKKRVKGTHISVPDNYSDNTAARSKIGLKTSTVMRPGGPIKRQPQPGDFARTAPVSKQPLTKEQMMRKVSVKRAIRPGQPIKREQPGRGFTPTTSERVRGIINKKRGDTSSSVLAEMRRKLLRTRRLKR